MGGAEADLVPGALGLLQLRGQVRGADPCAGAGAKRLPQRPLVGHDGSQNQTEADGFLLLCLSTKRGVYFENPQIGVCF